MIYSFILIKHIFNKKDTNFSPISNKIIFPLKLTKNKNKQQFFLLNLNNVLHNINSERSTISIFYFYIDTCKGHIRPHNNKRQTYYFTNFRIYHINKKNRFFFISCNMQLKLLHVMLRIFVILPNVS